MWFKIFGSTILISAFLFSCTPAKQVTEAAKPQKIEFIPSDQDSTEYELIIMDAGFESWFNRNRKPKWYYTNEYLATWNYQYVVAWNTKVRDPFLSENRSESPFTLEIDYRPSIDYGIDLNYKLYHYFRYIEATWGRILPFERQND